MKKYLLLTIFLCSNVLAKETIYVTHYAISQLLQDLKVDANIVLTHEVTGDAHTFEPDIAVIKKIKQANRLISAPMGLHPWLRNAINQNGKNLILATDPQLLLTYPHSDAEILAHFWIYPEALCSSINSITKYLTQEHIPFQNISCSNKMDQINLKGKIVIIAHDAFEPLFNKLGARVISIMGSGHHSELKADKLKNLWDQVQKNQTTTIYWVKEVGIKFPESALKLKKKNDIEIEIHTDRPERPITEFSKNILIKFK